MCGHVRPLCLPPRFFPQLRLPHASWFSTNKLISVFSINLIVVVMGWALLSLLLQLAVLVGCCWLCWWLHFVISFLMAPRIPAIEHYAMHLHIYAWNRLIAIQATLFLFSVFFQFWFQLFALFAINLQQHSGLFAFLSTTKKLLDVSLPPHTRIWEDNRKPSWNFHLRFLRWASLIKHNMLTSESSHRYSASHCHNSGPQLCCGFCGLLYLSLGFGCPNHRKQFAFALFVCACLWPFIIRRFWLRKWSWGDYLDSKIETKKTELLKEIYWL